MTVCHVSEGSGRLVQTYIFASHDLDQTVKSTLRNVEVEGADLLQHCLLPHKTDKSGTEWGQPLSTHAVVLCTQDAWCLLGTPLRHGPAEGCV